FPIKKYFECESNDFRGWGISRSERVLKREPFFVSTYQEISLLVTRGDFVAEFRYAMTKTAY
ncbi:MAG: hypothetical protein K2M11_07115, partial [Paramuribaculum sp.]|nr:hypothetical protein [Paramuribaculum sp.]